jgi:YidC/Oxa1 family membrane protein insertase
MINKKWLILGTLVFLTLVLSGCVSQAVLDSPITQEEGFFTTFIVLPVAWLMYSATRLLGGSFFFGILATTLIVRTLGWPIYSKSNDMTIKMQAMQPEQQKIQAKYEGKSDKDSQARMQQETMGLYKKYGVNPLGCLLPFLQLPIFLAVYYAVRRLPNNIGTGYLDMNVFNGSTQILGLDLLKTVSTELTASLASNWMYLLIPLFTGVTMFLVTTITQQRQKRTQKDVPDYRKNERQVAMQRQTQFMMYFLVLMMVYITYISPAALGIYWIFGNTYSLIQTTINYRIADKKLKVAT